MKKSKVLYSFLSTILCFPLVLAFGSCQNKQEQQSGNSSEQNTEESTNTPTEKPLWDKDNSLKILAIGNSFSDDTMDHVYQIAKSLGIKSISLGNLYVGSCTIARHVQNATIDYPEYDYRTIKDGKWVTQSSFTIKDALTSENWDFITMQQASGVSGIEESYDEVPDLVDYVTQYAPQARLAWNMTWAYQQDSTHPHFANYDNSQEKMYNMIISTVKSQIVTNKSIEYIIPNGTAIQNARTSKVGDTLTRDGHHLSLYLGRYIAGLTLVHTLTGYPLKDINYAPPLSEEEKQIAIESAENAVKEPFKITNSKYV